MVRRGEPAPPAGLAAWSVEAGDSAVAIFSLPVVRSGLERLTDAEREVVRRVLAGSSNAAIAQERGCSVRTVANLLARSFRKLGVTSRRELAATLEEHGW